MIEKNKKQGHRCHVKPVIYTTYSVYYQYIKGGFKEYPLWIRNVYFPPDWHMKGEWTFWQYTDTAVMNGYAGNEKYIDRNMIKSKFNKN